MTQEPQTYKEPSVCADKMATNCMGAGQGSVVCSRGEGAGLGGGRLGLDLLDHVGRQRRLARRPVTQRALPLVDRGKRRLHTSSKRTQLANPSLEVILRGRLGKRERRGAGRAGGACSISESGPQGHGRRRGRDLRRCPGGGGVGVGGCLECGRARRPVLPRRPRDERCPM